MLIFQIILVCSAGEHLIANAFKHSNWKSALADVHPLAGYSIKYNTKQ